MKIMKRIIPALFVLLILMSIISVSFTATVFAEDTTTEQTTAVEQTSENSTGSKAVAAGIAIGLAAAGGAIAMGIAIAKSVEGISRQPEAEGKIRTSLMLGLVFVETAIIYALIVAILIIFVL